MLQGIDLSEFQGTIDFQKLKNSKKVDFAYIRATQGLYTNDEKFKEYHDGLKNVGIPFAPYHFFSFRPNGATQAQHFLNTIDGYEGQLLPMLDLEQGGIIRGIESTVQDRQEWVSLWIEYVVRNLNIKNILIYTNPNDWENLMGNSSAYSKYLLWVAEYNNDTEPSLPVGFKQWTLWQYSSSGKIDGITENSVDLNKLNGSLSLLLR